MNKLVLLLAIIFSMAAVAYTVNAAPLTLITGTITFSNSSAVVGANVTVTCQHLGVNTTQMTTTDMDGKYYVFYPSLQCNNGDTAWTMAEYDGVTGMNSGVVSLGKCRINTAIIDVTIPEFGVVAGMAALALGVGIVLFRRRH